MSGLTLTITHAGRAALINAEHNGTAPVKITQVGVTATAFDPAPTATSLPGEIKRLSTISGQNVAADTVHITIRDDSTSSYTLRGFGLYLNDGTLFAVYGQSGAVMQKSAQSLMLLSVDIKLLQVAASSITFGNANFLNPPATTSVQGVIELATAAEAKAATDNARAITPATLKATLDARLPDDMAGKVDKNSNAPEDISEYLDSGFYRRSGITASAGWPVDDQWSWHLLSMTAWNNSYSAMQFACALRNNTLYFRTTNGDGMAPWVKLWHSDNFDPGNCLKLTGGTLSGNLKIERDGEAQLWLKCTATNGREVILLSSPTANVGIYDVTNNKWLFQIRADDLVNFKGFYGSIAVHASETGNAGYWLRDETNTQRGTVFWNRDTNSLNLQRYNTGGDNPEILGRLRIMPDGTVKSDEAISAPQFLGKATSAEKLTSSSKINGTSFNGTADIITARWGAERMLKIGNKSQPVNGSGNVTWTLVDMGAAAATHTHAWSELTEKPTSFTPAAHSHSIDDVTGLGMALEGKVSKTGGTMTGNLKIERSGEVQVWLNCTAANGREIILVSNVTGNTGLYDATGNKWLFRIDGNDNTSLAGNLTTAGTANAAMFRAKSAVGQNTAYWLMNENNERRGVFLWDRNNDRVQINRYDPETEEHAGWFRLNGDNTFQTSHAITAPSFNGTATSADKLGTARTLKIGGAEKAFDGSGNVAWTLADIGAAEADHSHAWSAISGKPEQATRWPNWSEVSGKPDNLVTQAHYTSSKTANGWMKRPDGIIEQWGLYILYTNSEITRSVTFPIAFPNGCFNVNVTDINPSVNNKDKYDMTAQVNQGSITATGFGVFIQAPGGVGNNWQGMYWRAIGH